MSRIKRLKLKGFKSFANPTVLNFEEGFNTIVGANGSGKSNVFDALCFVLGRMSSKGLRADKLGNLVFNGGKTSKPSKEAEVAIFLSNENKELLNIDCDEIKISRIVNKLGSSMYYINDKKATRTEILEILKNASINPDGYNIILQGDINKIVNMTPNERRELIEEISNISNYEEKRQNSLSKLEKVEIDLKEADLLLAEKTKYIKELKSEKELAEKYNQAKAELRFNNLLLIKSKLLRNKQLKDKKTEELSSNEKILEKSKHQLETLEKEESKIDFMLENLEKSIEIKSHQDFIEVTNKITYLEGEIQKVNEKKAELKKQIEEIKTKNIEISENIKNNNSEIKAINEKITDLINEKSEIEKKIRTAELKLSEQKKGLSTESLKKIDEIEQQIEDLNSKKYNKNQIKQENQIQIEKLNTKIEHLENDLNKIEKSNIENKEQIKILEQYRTKLKKAIIEISQTASNNSQASAKLNNLLNEYSELIEKHSKLKIRLESSKEIMMTNKAVDTIIKLKNKDNSICGTVAELASVTEKYAMAMETIAGKNLFNIVVENDATAVKYINYLKDNRIGNATFLPLNQIHKKFKLDESVLNKKGVIDYALNLVKYDPKYENIFHLIFADSIVIERIEDSKQIGIGTYKMVTLDGDIVSKSGAMTGGFKSKNTSMGIFKDDVLEEKMQALENKISSVSSSIDILKEEKKNSEEKLYSLRQEKAELEGEISKIEKILSINSSDKEIHELINNILSDKVVIENSIKKIDKDIDLLTKEIEELNTEKNKFKFNSNQQADIIETINLMEKERDSLKENLAKINLSIDSHNIQIKNVLTPDINNLHKIAKESEIAIKEFKEKLEELSQKDKELSEELKTNQKKEKELSKNYKEFIQQRDDLKSSRKKLEEEYDKEYSKFEKIKTDIATLNYSLSEFNTLNETLNEELDLVYEEIKSEFIMTGSDGNQIGHNKIEELITDVEKELNNNELNIKELQNKVNNIKSKINSFGSINLKAIEVYDMLYEEFNNLLEKRESLNIEKEDILKLIAEMDVKKKEKFLETFNKLKKNFIEVFSTLSTKGEVELILENENDIFNNGVDIRVRLTQKNYLDIKSLSGGEKTITAIAFIFAVQEFNPASFYIFDEVDAALDIMNAEKLGKLIRQYSKYAQYIVVSHSEHLIQSAEIIYGVTMDKYKISDVVSLDLRNMSDYIEKEDNKTKITKFELSQP